jgi:hypothetical protein
LSSDILKIPEALSSEKKLSESIYEEEDSDFQAIKILLDKANLNCKEGSQ